MVPLEQLLHAALEAQKKAYAPYSQFAVGAALEDEQGRVWSGANVECASYGLTICAERVALVGAVAQGVRRFRRLVVVSPGGCWPCGACRQLLAEFGADLVVIVADSRQPHFQQQTTLHELLPRQFRL